MSAREDRASKAPRLYLAGTEPEEGSFMLPHIGNSLSGDGRTKVLLVCSSGGHLAQLHKLRPWWSKHERGWVTFDMSDSRSLLTGEKVIWAYHPTTRNLPNLLRNLRLSWMVLRRYRPDIVVSSGAGVAFPFFLLSRLLGIKTVYVEVYDRIDSRTLTGRLCYPLSNLFVLQWETQRRMYPKGKVVGALA